MEFDVNVLQGFDQLQLVFKIDCRHEVAPIYDQRHIIVNLHLLLKFASGGRQFEAGYVGPAHLASRDVYGLHLSTDICIVIEII